MSSLSWTTEDGGVRHKKRGKRTVRSDITFDSKSEVWFTPPFHLLCNNNIGRLVLTLVDRHFGKWSTNRLKKIFNRNTVKVGYSTMPNFKSLVQAMNREKLGCSTKKTERTGCNCRKKETCPLPGACLTKNVIYRADLSSKDGKHKRYYIGLTSRTFKERYATHKSSFNHEAKRNATTLAAMIWEFRERGIEIDLKWSILKKIPRLSNGTQTCNLCLAEKEYIEKNLGKKGCLNTLTERVSKCTHLFLKMSHGNRKSL